MSDPKKLRDLRRRTERTMRTLREFHQRAEGEREAVPFLSRATLRSAVVSIKNCQKGDDDLMCVMCSESLDRIAATARLALPAKGVRTPHPLADGSNG